MHFWIDKRSQACGYSGRRRVPSSISTGLEQTRPRSWSGRTHFKLMVTPVHRFQSVECVAANSSRYHQRSGGAHGRSQAALFHHNPPSYSNNVSRNNHSHSVELDSGVFLDLPMEAVSGSSATPDPGGSHHILPAAKLKCGMWASFAIVTVFIAGAKFYFNNQGTGMEVIVFCSLLVVVLLAGCTVSLCEAVTSQPAAAAVVASSNAVPTPAELESSNQPSNEDLTMITLQVPSPLNSQVQTEPPPPPYHIAIMLPQQDHQIKDDSPPPPYDKAIK